MNSTFNKEQHML